MFYLLNTCDGYVFQLVTQGFTSLYISRKVSVKKQSKKRHIAHQLLHEEQIQLHKVERHEDILK